MSFFNLSDGSKVESTTEAEVSSGSGFDPIPDGTVLKAMVEDAKWKDANEYNNRLISLTWLVLDGEFKGRKVFHNIKICDTDAKKKDSALRMFIAVDANAGGKIFASGKEPTDYEMMAALANKPMTIRARVWEMEDKEGNKRSGNWVDQVGSASGAKKPAPKKEEPASTASMDDDIAF